jgi:hypothetical protein
MHQNRISLSFTDAQLTEIDTALSTLEQRFSGLVALTIDERRSLPKMGDKSEAFCRQTLTVLGNNPALLPSNFDLPESQRDLASLDALRPRLARLTQLVEKVEDSATALGSDVMSAALEGYALLRVSGRGQGLEALRQDISARFSRGSRPAATPAPATPIN